ncbi:MAG: polysaccharide deacetylase family protein [Proteobacteria bacterium]|nr:polysaccharide deacetylase family protein [Pseudomonadota bacterium]
MPKLGAAAVALAILFALAGLAYGAQQLQSPALHLKGGAHTAPRIALTFDACMGGIDRRILNVLVEQRVKATIFVTARWLKYNREALAIFLAHPELFTLEDHGAQHEAPIDWPGHLFGVKHAGSLSAVHAEIIDGAKAITAATGKRPKWYRGATAWYSPKALIAIKDLGYRLGGYSLSGDGGAQYSRHEAERMMLTARDGDVILAHINQPKREAGQGVADAIIALKQRGYVFVGLDDAEP